MQLIINSEHEHFFDARKKKYCRVNSNILNEGLIYVSTFVLQNSSFSIKIK